MGNKIINSMQFAIIKKDLMSIISNKQLFLSLFIVPVMFTVIMPVIFIITIYFTGQEDISDLQPLLDILPASMQSEDIDIIMKSMVLNYLMPTFFMLIPILTASVMAASAFVGEKEKRTLETLLYCPLTVRQIFQSKVWASFFLSMAVSLASFIVMIIVTETGFWLVDGAMVMPDFNWLFMLLIVSPAVSLLAIILIVGGSAKAKTVEESQQRSLFLILPWVLIMTVQFTGVVFLSSWYLLGVGVIFAALAFILMKKSMRKFTYEQLLKS